MDKKTVGGQVSNMVSDANGVVTIGTNTLTNGVKNAMESIAGKNKYKATGYVIDLTAE
jgi:hypothetical protein